MSRLSQMILFINAKPIPNQSERTHYYTSISNFDELKAVRARLRKAGSAQDLIDEECQQEFKLRGI